MAFCGHASAWAKLALLLLIPAIALHCAGLGTPYWMKIATVGNDINLVVGLWKQANCSGDYDAPCIGQALDVSYETDLLTATRGLQCTVVIPASFALLLSAFYTLSPAARTQKVAAWIMIFSFISMTLGIAGAVTWILNLPENHYVFWSLGLTLVGSAIFMMCGVIMIPDIRMYDYQVIKRKRIERKVKKEAKRKKKREERH